MVGWRKAVLEADVVAAVRYWFKHLPNIGIMTEQERREWLIATQIFEREYTREMLRQEDEAWKLAEDARAVRRERRLAARLRRVIRESDLGHGSQPGETVPAGPPTG